MKPGGRDAENRTEEVKGEVIWRASTREILTELARRLSVRFGNISVAVHNGQPSTKIIVDHRELRDID